jgi:hypothetical protein
MRVEDFDKLCEIGERTGETIGRAVAASNWLAI